MKILSIDAWGNKEEGYDWNTWYTVGEISKEEFGELTTDKKVLAWMRRNGFTTTANKRLVYVYDDQANLVICDRKTDCPMFAIEYFNEV